MVSAFAPNSFATSSIAILRGSESEDHDRFSVQPACHALLHPIALLTKALSGKSELPEAVRQIAILVTGAHFKAAYEIYAHVPMAERDGLPDAKLATIVAGQRPPDLTQDEGVAYDVAAALTGGRC